MQARRRGAKRRGGKCRERGGDWLKRRGLERGVGGEEAGEAEAARVAVKTRRRVAVEDAAAS